MTKYILYGWMIQALKELHEKMLGKKINHYYGVVIQMRMIYLLVFVNLTDITRQTERIVARPIAASKTEKISFD